MDILVVLSFLGALIGLLVAVWWFGHKWARAQVRIVELERVLLIREGELVACSEEICQAQAEVRQMDVLARALRKKEEELAASLARVDVTAAVPDAVPDLLQEGGVRVKTAVSPPARTQVSARRGVRSASVSVSAGKGVAYPATELLRNARSQLDARTLFACLAAAGLLEEVSYVSSASHGRVKTYKRLTASGLAYGENLPTLSPVATEPRFYEHSFDALLRVAKAAL